MSVADNFNGITNLVVHKQHIYMVTDRIIALPSIFLYKTKYEILVFKTTCSMYKLKSILQKTLHYRFKSLVRLAVEADMERVQLHRKP